MPAALVLIDLSSQASWEFQFFPNELRTVDRANWRPQETTTGTMPLFYENREPRRLSFPELYLDNTETGVSVTETLADLKAFTMDEQDDTGMPPVLLATWGDRKERCVLEEIQIEEIYFTEDGDPTRAKIGLELLEIQPIGEATSVHVTEDIF
jgi:hypothetical protein